MSCGVGRRGGSDPSLLRLQCTSAAVAPIQSLAWEPPHTIGAALKRPKKKKKKKKKKIIKLKKKGLGMHPLMQAIQSPT